MAHKSLESESMILTELESVRMKRNTAMTIIESSDVQKTLVSIKRQILRIKHQSKKVQLLNVISELEDNVTKHIKTTGKKTGIFCIGQKIDGDIYYRYIDADPKVSSYDYDDVFHVFKIAAIICNFQTATSQEIQKLIKRSVDAVNQQVQEHQNDYDVRYFVGDEINQNIDLIRTIYHFTTSENPTNVPIKWIGIGKEIKLVIDHKFDRSSPLSLCKAVGI